jgi:PAS domain S-box-containing protein
MKDQSKTKQALIQELASLRQRITELEQSESEQKRLGDVLRLNNEILANMKEGVALIRVDEGVIVYANPCYDSMFGYDSGELVGKHVRIVNAPGEKTPEDVANEIIISLNQAGEWQGEVHNLRKDGTSFWCDVHVSTFKHPQYGKMWIAVHQDITNRKQVEEALKEMEVQYRNLFENANEAIFVAQDGWLVFLNPMSTMMIGYSGEELMAKSFTEFIHPDGREMVINRHSRRMKGEEIPFPYSFRIIHKDGNSKWVEVNPVLINWIGRPATLNFMSDITDRKQVEETLRESEEKYRSLFENTVMGISQALPDGRLITVNNAYAQMYGYENAEEMMAEVSHVKQRYANPEDREEVLRILKEKGVMKPREIVVIHRNGTRFSVLVSAREIRDSNGNLQYYQAEHMDISQRKQAEETLRERDIQVNKLTALVPGMMFQFTKRSDGTYCVPLTTEAIKDIFGCSPQDVRDDFSPIAGVILPEDFDKVINSIEDSAKHLTTWTCEYRVQIPGQSIRWILGKSTPEKLADGGIIWHGFNTDITERKRAEEELRTKTKDIEEANTALKVLLNQLEKGRNDLEERILSNIRELILPYVNNLRHGKLSVHQVSLVDTIKSNLNRISSSFLQHLKLNFYDLTPREIEVANLVREGRSIKEIAELLSITIRTVESHRKRLRVKMGLKNRKANLRAHLLGLQ